MDLVEQARESQIHGVVKQFMGGPPEAERLSQFKKASPVNYISAKTPALLLIYGAADLQIPIITADEFVLKLAKAGVQDVTYHCWALWTIARIQWWPYLKCNRRLINSSSAR